VMGHGCVPKKRGEKTHYSSFHQQEKTRKREEGGKHNEHDETVWKSWGDMGGGGGERRGERSNPSKKNKKGGKKKEKELGLFTMGAWFSSDKKWGGEFSPKMEIEKRGIKIQRKKQIRPETPGTSVHCEGEKKRGKNAKKTSKPVGKTKEEGGERNLLQETRGKNTRRGNSATAI